MTLLCLAPLVFVGYAHTIQTDWHTSANISGPFVEAQTCIEGFGARVAFSQDWVQAGPQYGYRVPLGAFSLTGQIHGGLGYSNTAHRGIRQVTLYNGGVNLVLAWQEQVYFKVGYEHMSNGSGMNAGNVGQDMATFSLSWVF